ncbi:SMI1/KNR4 family protein [Mucilaginibacter sp. HMF5004]|uniref:SMI1/KNR4 family protein n=1 Tax=Mucilaginibacter rivuli TaxID=2857527 RepID=UPI001C5FAD90|nr:SMI1/KNR4 family protein [Mucilaginibacter rivuli]MBW4888896.1 SMI1/KNR4 family protein [Mucilaginibacter rivuli]
MESWVQKAISQWTIEGLKLNPAVTVADIANAEEQIGFSFPDDFKQLYLTVNGFVDFEFRGFFMLSLWSLERILADYDKTKELIMFSDHSISLCQYGFNKNKTGLFRAWTHHQQGPVDFIAESFRQIIELINSDSQLLLDDV